MTTRLGRDALARMLFLGIGTAVGLRAAQVIRDFSELTGYNSIAAGGTLVGLVVTLVFLAMLGVAWDRRHRGGVGAARLWAACAGIIGGFLAGWLLVRFL